MFKNEKKEPTTGTNLSNELQIAPSGTPIASLTKWIGLVPKDYVMAVISVFAVGIATHLFVYMNGLFLGDGIKYYERIDSSLYNTRWLAYILTIPFRYFNLPWAIGLTTLFITSFSVFLLYRYFSFQTNFSRVLVSAVVVTFPTFTAIHAYMSSAHAYAFAMLTACLAAYTVCYMKNKLFSSGIAMLFLILTCSTYQAYICVSAVLMILFLVKRLLMDEIGIKEIVSLAVRCALVLVISLILYYLLIRFLSIIGNIELRLRGATPENLILNTHGSFQRLPSAFLEVISFYIRAGSRTYQANTTTYAYRIIIIMSAGLIAYFCYKNKLYKKPGSMLFIIILFLALPIAMNIFRIAQSPGYSVHILMQHSYCIPIVFAIYLLEKAQIRMSNDIKKLMQKLICWGLTLALCVIILNYWILAHITYANMNKTYYQSLLQANRIVYDIQSSKGYTTDTPVMFVGNFTNPSRNEFEIVRDMAAAGYSIAYPTLVGYFYWFVTDHLFVTINYYLPNQAKITEVENDPRFIEMPIYPNQGYLMNIDGIIIVKLQ